MTAAAPDRPAPDRTLTVGPPTAADGPALHRIAAATGVLDVNSRYAYVLWCRDFAATSVVARLDDEPVGFVTGYRRPDDPAVLFVWQVAVGEAARGRGVAGAMLDTLFAQVPDTRFLETTVTADNAASLAMFTAFARRNDTAMTRSELFDDAQLGEGHEPEDLYRIGPIPAEIPN